MSIASGLAFKPIDLAKLREAMPPKAAGVQAKSESKVDLKADVKTESKSTFADKLNSKSKAPNDGPKTKPGQDVVEQPANAPVAPTDEIEGRGADSEMTEDRIFKKVAGKSIEASAQITEPLTKQQAMQAFLGRMQTELDIEPSDVLQAFAQLDADMLMASPEESAEQFLQNLELNPEDKDKAMLLYSDLLTWRSTADLSQKLKTDGQSAQLSVLSNEELVKRERMEGLTHLSDRFFMMGDYGRAAKLSNVPQAMKAYSPAMSALDKPVMAMTTEAAIPVADSQMLNTFDIAKLAEGAQPKMSNPSGLEAMASTEGEIDLSGLDLEAASADDLGFDLKQLSNEGNASQGFAESGDQTGLGGLAVDQDTDGESTEVKADEFKGQLDSKIERSESPKSFNVGAPTPTDMDMSENVREVIRGAQVMVKNGGGEMKINLSPEGMGELNLKVMVQNGEVKVEMITSSEETKKLLEKGLSELKQSLSTHKLNVEHLKIETSQKASEQMMQDKQESADRGFQQRFLQDFRDQNFSKRFQTMGISSARELSSQTNDPAANDIDASARKRRLERRLDLVA